MEADSNEDKGETSFMPPKLVIEMLPDENLSLFERIKNSFPSVKRETSDGSTSAASDTEDRRDSIKSNFSFSSVDLTNRRASSASTLVCCYKGTTVHSGLQCSAARPI